MNVIIQIPDRNAGLPLSVPYRKLTSIRIEIVRDASDPVGAVVSFDVLNCSSSNAWIAANLDAEVRPNFIMAWDRRVRRYSLDMRQ